MSRYRNREVYGFGAGQPTQAPKYARLVMSAFVGAVLLALVVMPW